MKNFIIICPNCNEPVIIQRINCGIFRHGVIKQTNKPIPPHLSKVLCDELIKKNLIFGCGKPFQIIQNKNENEESMDVSVCDYI